MDWKNFNKTNVKSAFPVGESKHILAMRRDGKVYSGIVDHVTEQYVEISNGDDQQILYYARAPMQFTVVSPPPLPSFGMAAPRLKLED